MLNTTVFTGDLVDAGGEITEQQGTGALFPLPFPLTGGMAFFKPQDFTCNCTDFSSSDEQVSDNKKYSAFHSSVQSTKIY